MLTTNPQQLAAVEFGLSQYNIIIIIMRECCSRCRFQRHHPLRGVDPVRH